MSTQIKNTLTFDLEPGESVVLTHELNNGTIPVTPDHIEIPSPALEVTAVNDTTLTLRNGGGVPLAGAILVEWWHTFERAFGDAADENLPVKPFIQVGAESANSPPQPPFQDPPLTLTIYARTTGNDTTGNGTLANPYRTMQRAVRDVPNFVPPGVRYIVDITGIGVETLPDDYVLPVWKSAFGTTGYSDDPFFYGLAAVTIRAYPQPPASLSPANQVIPNAAVTTAEPFTGFLTFTDPTKTWVPGELVGMFVVGDFFDVSAKAPIIANTATSVTIAHDDPTSLLLPAQIVEISATLEGKNAVPSFGNGALGCDNQDSLCLQGLRIQPTDIASPAPSRGLRLSGGTAFPELCHLVNGAFDGFNRDRFEFVSCIVEGGYLDADVLFGFNNRFLGGVDGITWFSDQVVLFSTSFEGCNTVSALSFALIIAALIEDSLGDGFGSTPGAFLLNMEINDSTDNGIHANTGDQVSAFNIGGTGNGGVGIRVNNGAMVESDYDGLAGGPTVIAGVGGQQQVGDLVAGNFPAAGADLYDITAVGAGGATGTGARLYS